MPFVVNPIRQVKFNHVIVEEGSEPVEFTVTFNFIPVEDVDYVELRRKSEGKETYIAVDEKGKEKEVNMGMYNAFLYTLRTSLMDCSGIVDPNGNELNIKDEKGNVIENNQIAIFEAIRAQTDLFDKICIAYIGNRGKNG